MSESTAAAAAAAAATTAPTHANNDLQVIEDHRRAAIAEAVSTLPEPLRTAHEQCAHIGSRSMWVIPNRLCISPHPSTLLDMGSALQDLHIDMVVSLSYLDAMNQERETKHAEQYNIAFVRYAIDTRHKLPGERVFLITRLVMSLLNEQPACAIMLCDDVGTVATSVVATPVVAMLYHCTLENAARYMGLRYNHEQPHARALDHLPASKAHMECAADVYRRLKQPRIESMLRSQSTPTTTTTTTTKSTTCTELATHALVKAWLPTGSPPHPETRPVYGGGWSTSKSKYPRRSASESTGGSGGGGGSDNTGAWWKTRRNVLDDNSYKNPYDERDSQRDPFADDSKPLPRAKRTAKQRDKKTQQTTYPVLFEWSCDDLE
jgi:hypothetical protein